MKSVIQQETGYFIWTVSIEAVPFFAVDMI